MGQQPLNVKVPKRLRRAMEIYALEHGLTLSQAVRLLLSRTVMPPAPYYTPPALPNWQVEAWTSLLRGIFGSEHLVLTADVKPLLRQAVAALDDRQARVLHLRFGLDGPQHTGAEVAALMGWDSRQRVYQVEAQALRRVRGWCRVRGIWKLLKEQLDKEAT